MQQLPYKVITVNEAQGYCAIEARKGFGRIEKSANNMEVLI